jgi:hypothetical protein
MRKLPDIEELLDLWLVKYHNTTMQKVREEHTEWMENPQEHTRDFYQKYAVTQEQHDEWEKEAKLLLRKKYRISKWMVEKGWWSVYLNCSPSIIKEN